MDKIIHTKYNSDLDLYIDKDDRYIIFIDSEVLKIGYHIKKAKAKIIYIVLEELDIDLIEDGKIEDSEVTIAFIDVSKSVLKAQSRIEVKDHASLSLISKYLVSTDKDIDILCTNASKDTAVAIDNSAVALDAADVDDAMQIHDSDDDLDLDGDADSDLSLDDDMLDDDALDMGDDMGGDFDEEE